jgi:hypothetical protein
MPGYAGMPVLLHLLFELINNSAYFIDDSAIP